MEKLKKKTKKNNQPPARLVLRETCRVTLPEYSLGICNEGINKNKPVGNVP